MLFLFIGRSNPPCRVGIALSPFENFQMSDYPHNIPFNNGWHFDLTQYSKRFESAIWDLFGQAPDEDQSVLVMSYIPNREGKGPECVTADTSTKVENELEVSPRAIRL